MTSSPCKRETVRHTHIFAHRHNHYHKQLSSMYLLPVSGCRHPVAVANLQRIDYAQDFVKVASGRGRVRQRESDDLLRVNDEYRPDCEGDTLEIAVGWILVVEHVVERGNVTIRVGDNREVQLYITNIVDVLDPLLVIGEIVGRETDGFDVTLLELIIERCDKPELRGADGG
ncbi:hypothetical protein BC936DRAFT_146491 [Jimgerdemannia flammicorona]|uniref:Uncharacterized protein n=1 Tax=Jimgerdemannia flammicorona TaxID=994334 RepID=A0A433D7G4_9FUNG|nr:hypothetical protein BC936DRAFT_146491 [Jimgerdemannia flammicorona]